MGQRKRATAATAPTAGTIRQPGCEDTKIIAGDTSGDNNNPATGGEELVLVRAECEKALVALRRGNSTKALRLIKDACHRHALCSLAHRVHGHICVRLASIIEDPPSKHRYLKDAAQAARIAASLSPRSIEYAYFHAQLLFETSPENTGFDHVIQECERGLSIPDPLDPAKESLYEDGQQRFPTPHARIANLQQDLKSLAQKANIASISTWVKTLSNGDEKLRLIPVRKLIEDPMEQCLSQPKRPHEIKKSVKSAEDRRKEIEVRVAAARLLQQRGEVSSQSQDGGNLTLKSNQRPERRKVAGHWKRPTHTLTQEERIERVRPFWNAVDALKREIMLEAPLDELLSYLELSKNTFSAIDINEGLEFFREFKTWRFWTCCRCGEKFADSQDHGQHIMQEHIDSLSPKLQSILPHEIDQDWSEELMNEDYRPFDGAVALLQLMEIATRVCLEETPNKPVSPKVTDVVSSCSSNVNNHNVTLLDTHIDSQSILADQLSLNLDKVTDTMKTFSYEDQKQVEFSKTILENNEKGVAKDHANLCNGEHQGSTNGNGVGHVQRLGRKILPEGLPIATDEERAKLLERIYSLLRILFRNRCLAADHVLKIVQYAIEELESFNPDASVRYAFDHSLLYIRFLPAQQLRTIHKYLYELVHACGLDCYSHCIRSPPDSADYDKDDTIQDDLYLSEDLTKLVLSEQLLKKGRAIRSSEEEVQSDAHSFEGVVKLGKGKVTTGQSLLLTRSHVDMNASHADQQLPWVYSRAEYEIESAGWKQLCEDRAHEGREILRSLEKEVYLLQGLCEKKREHVIYEEALSCIERLCIEESKRIEKGPGRSYETVLRERQQELLEGLSNGLSSHWKSELDAITSILRDIQCVQASHLSFDGKMSTISRLSDSDDEEDADHRIHELIHRDSGVEATIQRQKERLATEVNKLDGKILKALNNTQKLERKLKSVSAFDYRTVVLPLVKSFLKARLEDAAEKYAVERSDAAREAFLAELAHDRKSNINKLQEATKQLKESTKDKKKNKDQKKAKDLKGGSSMVQERTLECIDVNGDSVEDYDDLSLHIDDDVRQQQAAKLSHQVEVEVNENNLAETMEVECRIEAAVQLRHISEVERRQNEDAKVSTTTTVQRTGTFAGGQCAIRHGERSISEDFTFKCCDTWSLSACHQGGSHSTSSSLDGRSVPESLKTGCYVGNDLPTISDSSSSTFHSKAVSSVTNVGHVNDLDSYENSGETFVCTEAVASLQIEHELEVDKTFSELIPSHNVQQQNMLKAKSRKSGKSRRKKAAQVQESNGGQGMSKDDPYTEVSAVSDEHPPFPKPFAKVTPIFNTDVPLLRPGDNSSKIQMQQRRLLSPNSKNGSKTFMQLKAEQDDEERFQADLEQAMRQSLDMYSKGSVFEPLDTCRQLLKVDPPEKIVLSPSSSENQRIDLEEIGKGLQNENGQYNCFLNAVIQSLWHLRKFRVEFLAMSTMQHAHVGDPCVICALQEIFAKLSTRSDDTSKASVAPTRLRSALSTLYSESNFFQEAQMNDASEVLLVVFDCLHKAFAPNPAKELSGTSSGYRSWDCDTGSPCIVHGIFGLDIAQQMNCRWCGLESRHLKFTSFFHNINASALRTAKIMYQESSLDELLKLVDMNHQLPCDIDISGCGRQNYIHHFLRAAPLVFTIVLGWQNNRESAEDIWDTVIAIETEIDVGVVYRGLDEGYRHRLVSVVCYYGQHYHCFAYSQGLLKWIMFDDTTVKVVGTWEEVTNACRKGRLQPQVLFYEAS